MRESRKGQLQPIIPGLIGDSCDANGNNVGPVSAEIPAGPKCVRFGKQCLAGTTQKFPFAVKTRTRSKFANRMLSPFTDEASARDD